MNTPKPVPSVSIITPFRNAALWIAECIRSGMNQDFEDCEWIFVDDHSADDSRSIVAAFAEKDERIKVCDNPGKGILPALRKALAEAKGTYITRMDADDLMPEGRLGKMVSVLEVSPPKTVVTGLVKYFTKGQVSEGYRKYESWLNEIAHEGSFYQNIYRECPVASPNWMMRRSELNAIGGFDNLTYPEDYDLVFRWYQNHFKIKAVPETSLHWREHPQRTSRNSTNYAQEAFFRLKLIRFVEMDWKESGNLCLWGTGVKGKLSAKILNELQVPFHWMDLNAKKIDGREIIDYRNTKRLQNPQILLAVYPPEAQMQKLKAYLEKLKLTEGRNLWFL